jgi:hypothetical protein
MKPRMDIDSTYELAWTILGHARNVSKPLLWLRDTDSLSDLVPETTRELEKAFHRMLSFPQAPLALCNKLCAIYDRALREKLVGIGSQPISSRYGQRTSQNGLDAAIDHARKHRDEFCNSAYKICSSSSIDLQKLFDLTKEFIDDLDWGLFVFENARGQAISLVLESVELLSAICNENDEQKIHYEIGDVFYSLIAFSLSLGIYPNLFAEKFTN